MTYDDLKAYLQRQNVEFEEQPAQYGHQLRCKRTGEIFIFYYTGKFVAQGKATELARSIRRWADGETDVPDTGGGSTSALPAPPQSRPLSDPAKSVFIVYGHDTGALESLELQIRRFGLDPIILRNLPAGGDTAQEID